MRRMHDTLSARTVAEATNSLLVTRRALLVSSAASLLLSGRSRAQQVSSEADPAALSKSKPELLLHYTGRAVHQVAISPQNRYVLTSDGAIRLWEYGSGQELRRIEGYACADFSPDGRTMLVAGAAIRGQTAKMGQAATDDNQMARLLDIRTGREVRRFVGDTRRVHSVAFSPDAAGKYVLMVDNAARLFDTTTGKEILRLEGIVPQVPEEVKSKGLKNAQEQERARQEEQQRARQNPPAAGSNNTQNYRGGLPPSPAHIPAPPLAGTDDEAEKNRIRENLRIQLEDMRKRRNTLQIPHEQKADIRSASFSTDGTLILTTSADAACLWETATGKLLKQYMHPGEVVSSPFIKDGMVFLAPGIQVGPSDYYLIQTVFSGEISPDGTCIMTASGNMKSHAVQILDIKTGEVKRRFAVSQNIFSATFSPDGKEALTAGRDGALTSSEFKAHLWDIKTGREIHPFPWSYLGEGIYDKPALFSTDGRAALMTGSDGTSRLWDTATFKEIRRFEGYTNPALSSVFSSDGRSILLVSTKSLHIWETAKGKEVQRFEWNAADTSVVTAAFSPDNKYLMAVTYTEKRPNKVVHIWQTETWKETSAFEVDVTTTFAAVSPDARFAVTDSNDAGGGGKIWEAATGRMLRRIKLNTGNTTPMFSAQNRNAFSKDGKTLIIAGQSGLMQSGLTKHDIATGVETPLLTRASLQMLPGTQPNSFNTRPFYSDIAYSEEQHLVLAASNGALSLWDTNTDAKIGDLERQGGQLPGATFSPDGRFVLTSDGRTIRMWNTKTLQKVKQFDLPAYSPSVPSLSSNSRFALVQGSLWAMATGRELCRLISFQDGNWAVVDSEGRFDTGNLEDLKGFSWIMPDAPLKPLRPEIFLRDYFTPRLLPRFLQGEPLQKIDDISQKNRVQPLVKIKQVKPTGQPDTLLVTVEAQTRKEDAKASGLTNLRLFRDGQLVGWLPESDSEEGSVSCDSEGRAAHTFTVHLPHNADVKQVEFTAYAFNVARVKSETAHFTYTLPAPIPARKGRAYLVSLGSNIYETARLPRLSFAANDARLLQQTLGDRLAKTGQFTEVVRISLISDDAQSSGKTVRVRTATKANLKAILSLLAGQEAPVGTLQGIPGADKLRKATPDDVVILSFSCHGDADGHGNFYLFPFIGGDANLTPAQLYERGISDTELSNWLRGVDAGQMAMIVDACHSAASVENGEFKPGPMGSRGLGQLAYEKGMLLLAASQADDVALELGELKQGLLTYALTRRGLEKQEADWKPKDGKIHLAEWLAFGEARVPTLYEEIVSGRTARAGTPNADRRAELASAPPPEQLRKRNFQQPALFDFGRSPRPVLIEEIP